MRKLHIITLLLAFAASITAQHTYRIHRAITDSVQLSKVELHDNIYTVSSIDEYINVGDTITAIAKTGDQIIFRQGNHLRSVSDRFVIFCSDTNLNLSDNYSDTSVRMSHTWLADFFAQPLPYFIILALLILIITIGTIGCKYHAIRKAALAITPLTLMAIALLEILAYIALRQDVFWWCSEEKYGFFGAFLRLIPFALTVMGQVGMIYLYHKLLKAEGVAINFGSIRQLGWQRSLTYTFFLFTYLAACIIAIYMLVQAMILLIIQLLLAIAVSALLYYIVARYIIKPKTTLPESTQAE